MRPPEEDSVLLIGAVITGLLVAMVLIDAGRRFTAVTTDTEQDVD